MKTPLIIILALLLHSGVLAQTDGWYLYTRASEITKILPDDINADELHLATDIGYIKYNTTSGTVTDYLNLTSQNPAIGNVKDIALDPTSDDIAMTLKSGIAIYSMGDVTVYNYEDSDLSIGENTNQFYYLQAEYAKDGSLYIFKEDAFGYQKFNNGLFESENVTSFKPQDIVENNDGTKANFAGANNGLWQLDKGTMDWTNYTSSNSDLISNFVRSCHVDMNDLLYIGGIQGLNTLSSSGDWSTYQSLDPINAFPYQVHDFSINEVTGDLVIKTSNSHTYYYGLTMLDLNTNTWTNYREDGTNCLNENVYTATTFGGDGKVYAAPSLSFASPNFGKLVEFIPSSESCSEININYLNAPVAVNSNVISDFNIRGKTNGNLEMGFTRTFDLHTAEIDPTTFIGTFPTATTLTPSPGSRVLSVISDNNHFIVESNEGWHFIDENNDITTFNHNIPDYLAIITKKAAKYNSDNGIINIVHKGFDASFNYRVYKTQCNIFAATCEPSIEIFTTNRDLTQNVLFDVNEIQNSDEVHAVAIQTAATQSASASHTPIHQNPEDPVYTHEIWNPDIPNSDPVLGNSGPINTLFPTNDPAILGTDLNDFRILIFNQSDFFNIIQENNSSVFVGNDEHFDTDNNGINDEILDVITEPITGDELGNNIDITIVSIFTDGFESNEDLSCWTINSPNEGSRSNLATELTDAKFYGFPSDTFLRALNLVQYSNTEAMIVLLTNYGILLKTGIDISNLSLSTQDYVIDNEVILYPNPSNNIVSFSNNAITSAAVYDVNGRHIMNVKAPSFSVKDLANGVYIIKASAQNGVTFSRKLIKN